MPENKIIDYKGLTVDIENNPANDVLQFLDENEYGTPGGIIYQHIYASEKARNLDDTYFFTLRKEKRLIGNIAFVRRLILNGSNFFKAYYIRYLTVMPSYRRNLNVKKSVSVNKVNKVGLLKETMQNFFLNAEKFLAEEEKKEKYIFYANIEKDNQRSSMLSESFGYEKIAVTETSVFSRIFLRSDKRLEKIEEGDKNTMVSLLCDFYKDYSLYSSQNLFHKGNYYVFKDNNEIIAGVQANLITWKIKNMPGISGKFLLKVLPYVPLFSKLFNPECFRFLALESVYVKKGYEKELNKLFTSVCARFKVPVAMFWTDIKGGLNKIIKAHLDMGIFHKISKTMIANVYVKFVNFSEEDKKPFFSKPAYVSAFDLT